MKYDENQSNVIYGIERVSKLSRRVYVKGKDVKPVLNGMGISILSTSKGVMTLGTWCIASNAFLPASLTARLVLHMNQKLAPITPLEYPNSRSIKKLETINGTTIMFRP